MKQVEIQNWTTPDGLLVSEGPTPVCGPDQVRIRVKSVAITYSLWLLIQGRYQRKPALPFVPGSFAAGIVTERGDQARRFEVGDRVICCLESGGLAEEAVAWEACTYAIPRSLPFDRANMLNTCYSSVMAALTWPRLLDVQPGQRLLVTGASGGTGSAAVELGRILGASVVGTATTEAKRKWVLECGADHAIPSDASDLRDSVMELTNGEGVDAVLDPVGGDLFYQALRCLRPNGRIVPLGFAGGEVPKIPANIALVKNITIGGLNMGYYKLAQRNTYEQRIRAMFAQKCRWFEDGLIRPRVASVFSLDQVGDAFAAIMKRDQIGSVAVVFDDE